LRGDVDERSAERGSARPGPESTGQTSSTAGSPTPKSRAATFLEVAVALLQALNDLTAKPDGESPTFKRVRQARRHELWRVAHPYDPDVAVRIICWFPANDQIVLALVGFDKKSRTSVADRSRARAIAYVAHDVAVRASAAGRFTAT
jgi:hypothetical protein